MLGKSQGTLFQPSHFKWATALGLMALATTVGLSQTEEAASAEPTPQEVLGSDLFQELLFDNPGTDYGTSCAGCHVLGSSAPGKPPRFFADYTATSLTAGKGTTRRNTPTLLGLDSHERFGWDGSSDNLVDYLAGKLLSSAYGWQEKDLQRAQDNALYVVQSEGHNGPSGQPYEEQFKTAYDIDVLSLSREEAAQAAAQVLADYVLKQQPLNTSKWDAFATQNRFRMAPNADEDVINYAAGVESRIFNQEGRLLIRRPEGFTAEAYEGFKTFFRIWGDDSVGACVKCHVPPTYSDGGFHNVGTAQAEYDVLHGDGKFAALDLPPAGERPVESLSLPPSADDPKRADLGHWNYAAAEQAESSVGAFKTPVLRNLPRTDPYLHNGSAASLEDVVREKIRLAGLAQDGKLRSPDPVLLEMNLTDADIGPLVAFLQQLDELPPEDFRYYLINFDD